MAIISNLENFKESFREEAREIVIELETTLLQLHDDSSDMDLVGKAFRGLHTIKGSGSMFGFDELAAFTHKLENAFDLVRSGELAITPELVDLTLAALDQIALLVEGDSGSSSSGRDRRSEILAGVQNLMAGVLAVVEKGRPLEAPGDSSVLPAQTRNWSIEFAPGPAMMHDGTDPLLLVEELRQLGTLEVVGDVSAIPELVEIDPERCYIRWKMRLATERGQDSIRDIFIFVDGNCSLSVESEQGSIETGHTRAEAEDHLKESEIIRNGLTEPRSSSPGRRVYDKPDTASSIRVPAAKLDQFVDLVGELVTVQARLGEIAVRHSDADVIAVAEEIERLTLALRESSMNVRMLPIRSTFERFRRLVHDLARDLHKEVELTIEGADTELDKTVIDQLSDPLMHLIRNSMDHGIEPAQRRISAGKTQTARIHLSARYSGASVLITVSDDGGGIRTEAVRDRAIERGLISADAQLSEAEIYALIFEPGFSTAKQITDVSGRGVGMDVVRQRIDALRGSIDIASKAGAGTSITLRLPLTLAIIDGLLVSVDRAYFVLPLANTLECIELTREDIERANGKHVANVRGEIIPYIRLREHFLIRTERPEREQVMIVETEDGRYGFVVDSVLGDYQTVIKNLGRVYRHVQIISGATILGDGNIALILDPNRLVQDALRAMPNGVSALHRFSARGQSAPVGSVVH